MAEKDRRSQMAHSTVNAPAKKGGGGGQFTWGKAEDVTDYESVGAQGSKVSSAPAAVSAPGSGPPQPDVPDRSDSSHFPSLGNRALPPEPKTWAPHKGPALTFYIFGSPVKMSPSPDIHNPGFAKNGFPHTYDRFESAEVAEAVKVLRSDKCGGGSITIPHKESILKEMDELGDAAKRIGAVNTVTKLPNGKFRGDNTDWLGIKNLVESRLVASSKKRSADLTAVLCGAGGTARAAAYALQQMGVGQVYIYNRTTERAATLAEEFGFRVCEDICQVAKFDKLDILVNTLPGSTDFTMPAEVAVTLKKCHPVVLEASYIPRRTAFLKQAMDAGCPVIEGIEMLYEQGCEQCKIWTGRPAPRSEIARSLCDALFRKGSSHPAREKMEPISEIPQALAEQLSDDLLDGFLEQRSGPSVGLMLGGGVAVAAVAMAAVVMLKKR